MKDPELISTPADKHINGLPRHRSARERGKPPTQGALWNATEAQVFGDAPLVPGGFPLRFLEWAREVLGVTRAGLLLHVCSGGIPAGPRTIRVDVRASQRPDLVADGRALPLAEACVDAVLIDPPYSVEYARDLYGTDYPRPSHLLTEAARVVRPGGLVALLHYLVPVPPPALEFVKVFGVTMGCGMRIRALTVMRRPAMGLYGELEVRRS